MERDFLFSKVKIILIIACLSLVHSSEDTPGLLDQTKSIKPPRLWSFESSPETPQVPLREVASDTVFTLSHVHVPKDNSEETKTSNFLSGARWLLPRCRIKEAVNGQKFEHLHAGLPQPEGPYKYNRASVGFEDENMARGPHVTDVPVNHFLWFEEWKDWSGVEAHGPTGYGKLFHGKVDNFIEEEWTFYHPPVGAAPVLMPEPSYFNSASQRGKLHVAHLRTTSADQRAALLALPIDMQSGDFAVLLENRDRSDEFALVAEGLDSKLAPQMAAWLKAAPCAEASDVMIFGSPLWPEDMALQDADIVGDDEATFPKFHKAFPRIVYA